MPGRLSFTWSVLILFHGAYAGADLQKCNQTVREKIKQCNQVYEQARGQAAGVSNAGGEGSYETSKAVIQAANDSNTFLATVEPACKKMRDKCAEDCNAAGGKQANDLKYECFGQINEKIQLVNQIMGQNTTEAQGATGYGNGTRANDAEELSGDEGKVQKAAAQCAYGFTWNPCSQQCETTPGLVGPGGNVRPAFKPC